MRRCTTTLKIFSLRDSCQNPSATANHSPYVTLDTGVGQYLMSFSRGLPINIWFRICPGRYFADASLWIMMSNILAMFDIGPPLDASGNPQVIGNIKFTDGLTRFVAFPAQTVSTLTLLHADSHPEPFECTIRPRNAGCAALIQSLDIDNSI